MNIMMKLLSRCLLIAAGLSLLSACATNPVTGKRDLVLMSESQEISTGAKYHQSILKQYSVYDNPPLQRKINEIGQRLARESHRAHLNYKFTLLDSPQVNAFALPGGYIYITRGIIAYMNSEEELAGVLGHELGHVTARHGVRQHTGQTLAQLGTLAAGIATNNRDIAQLSGQLSTALVRGYGRNHELEADRLGAEYLARTGYDPEKMIDVVGILKDQEQYEIARARQEGREPRVYHGLFSTHPRNDDRLQTVIRAANQYKNPNAEPTDPNEFKRLLKGMTFGDSEKEGIVRGNHFYHKPLNLAITYPNGWKLQNGAKQLIAFNKGQDKVISLEGGGEAKGLSPAQFLQKIAPKAQQVTSLNNTTAIAKTAARTPFGNQVIPLVVKQHGGQMFVLSAFGKTDVEREVRQVAASMRPLNANEQALATAREIKLVRAKPGDTFESLAPRSSLKNDVVAQLRLINGKYPDGQPQPGELIKIVE